MFRALLHLTINLLMVFILASILPNFEVDNLTAAFVFIVILSLVNFFIIPVVKIFTLPLTLLTFGLFNIVINLFAVWLASNVDGINITGEQFEQLLTLLIMSVSLSIGHSFVSKYIDN
jgi:putative membrane protein